MKALRISTNIVQQVCDGVVSEINVGCGSTTPTPPNLKYSSETKIRIRKISEWDPSFQPHSELAYIFATSFKETLDTFRKLDFYNELININL